MVKIKNLLNHMKIMKTYYKKIHHLNIPILKKEENIYNCEKISNKDENIKIIKPINIKNNIKIKKLEKKIRKIKKENQNKPFAIII